MFRYVICVVFLVASAPAIAGKNCTCRYQGAEISEGQTACIRTPKGLQMAKCERVLNNTSWKFLDQPCPSARLDKTDQNMTVVDPAMPAILSGSG